MKVEAIFRKVGYPGKTLVGHPANEAAYYVIQHSDKIKKYFPLIEQAGQKGRDFFYPGSHDAGPHAERRG